MKWRDNSLTVKVKALKLPGDLKVRMKAPHVAELAESIKERTGGRPIHLPTVEWPTMRLLAGRDRVAAALVLGAKVIEVQTVEDLTDKERRDLERDENIHRRVDDRDELIRQRVEERTLEIEAKRAEGGEPEDRKPGRPKTPKGEAREQIAMELGTTPGAVRVAEARAENANKDSETPAPVAPPVETFGLPLVTEAEAGQLRQVQEAVRAADAFLKRAQGVLSPVAELMPKLDLGGLVTQIHGVAANLRSWQLVAACPFCKRRADLVERCAGCGGSGFAGADDMMAVADELKLGGAQAMVSAGGKLVPYASKPAAEKHAAKLSKRVKVVDDTTGEDITPPWEAEG